MELRELVDALVDWKDMAVDLGLLDQSGYCIHGEFFNCEKGCTEYPYGEPLLVRLNEIVSDLLDLCTKGEGSS